MPLYKIRLPLGDGQEDLSQLMVELSMLKAASAAQAWAVDGMVPVE